jgi:hypothetical protein
MGEAVRLLVGKEEVTTEKVGVTACENGQQGVAKGFT